MLRVAGSIVLAIANVHVFELDLFLSSRARDEQRATPFSLRYSATRPL